MTNVLQMGGSTLICTPGRRTGFALSHSNRSPVLLFELQPIRRSAEGVLQMLLDVLGSKADFVRYVIVVDAPAFLDSSAEQIKDAKAAVIAFAAACGAELRSLGWDCARAIADDAGIAATDATALASAVEVRRRKIAAAGDRIGELVHPLDPVRQSDHSELRALARYVKEAVTS